MVSAMSQDYYQSSWGTMIVKTRSGTGFRKAASRCTTSGSNRKGPEQKDRLDKKIFDLWLACWTQEEIAEECGCSQPTVVETLKDSIGIGNLSESDKAVASHAVDFDPPLYNVWKQREKTKGLEHFDSGL